MAVAVAGGAGGGFAGIGAGRPEAYAAAQPGVALPDEEHALQPEQEADEEGKERGLQHGQAAAARRRRIRLDGDAQAGEGGGQGRGLEGHIGLYI